jgi:hypothetical protein
LLVGLLLASCGDHPGPQDSGPQDSGPQDSGPEASGRQDPEAQLGRLTRRALEVHLAEALPWITQEIRALRIAPCSAADAPTCVDVEYAPHGHGPRHTRHRVVSCRRTSFDDWTCDPPSELTVVRLAQDDRGSLALGVSVPQAVAALSAVLLEARGAGIPNPLAGGEPLRVLAPDALQAVVREPSCADVLVLAHRPNDGVLLELCVEEPECELGSPEDCPLTVRLHGERSFTRRAGL